MNIADLGRVETYRDAARQSTRVHFPLYSQLDYEIRDNVLPSLRDPLEPVKKKLYSDEVQNECFIRLTE